MSIEKPDPVAMVEQALGVVLPDEYATVLRDHPWPITDDDDSILHARPETVIDVNLDYRNSGFFGQSLPADYLVVGWAGNGDIYVMSLTGPTRVYVLCHERTASQHRLIADLEAPTFSEWIRELKQSYALWETEEAQRTAKRWWQFWRS